MQHADNRRGAMLWWPMTFVLATFYRDYGGAEEAMDIALFKFLPETGGWQRPWHNALRAREILDDRPDWPGR